MCKGECSLHKASPCLCSRFLCGGQPAPCCGVVARLELVSVVPLAKIFFPAVDWGPLPQIYLLISPACLSFYPCSAQKVFLGYVCCRSGMRGLEPWLQGVLIVLHFCPFTADVTVTLIGPGGGFGVSLCGVWSRICMHMHSVMRLLPMGPFWVIPRSFW